MQKLMRCKTQTGTSVVLLLAGFGGAAAGFPVPADPIAQVAELSPSNPVHLDFFGASVAISGNTAVVGIGYNGFQKGEAYIFEKPASGWANSGALTHTVTGKAFSAYTLYWIGGCAGVTLSRYAGCNP
jgi:hypothetical protein